MTGREASVAISVDGLEIGYRTRSGWLRAVDRVCLEVRRGEIFGLVGESGSGKSTLALQMLGYRAAGAVQLAGSVRFMGEDMSRLDAASLQKLRGRRVSYVPQNPTTALNPSRRIGEVIRELLAAHQCDESGEGRVRVRVRELLSAVALEPRLVLSRYPHQLSGGQQQRVVIAMALACNPDLIVLDEPTTGLDVTTQKQILSLLLELRAKFGTSMLYVTHDLGVVEEIADRIGVMYAGSLVEIGKTREIFSRPVHPYTKGLIASVPRLGVPPDPSRMLAGSLNRATLGPGCAFQPRCSLAVERCIAVRPSVQEISEGHMVACLEWKRARAPAGDTRTELADRTSGGSRSNAPLLNAQAIVIDYGRAWGPFIKRAAGAGPAIRGADFQLMKGEVLALVGESGSGKSTLARAICGLVPLRSGSLVFDGVPLGPLAARGRELRRRIQLVFQNPDASLNPRRSIGQSLSRPLSLFFGVRGIEAQKRIREMLENVRLPAAYATRLPGELSGGERQRVAIARALLAEPDLILCDEVLSALDVSVQASILEMLKRLRAETGVSMLFVSHDLAVVEQIADRIIVLNRGEIVDSGPASAIFRPPLHPYTRSLLAAVPGSGQRLEAGPSALEEQALAVH
ncbi:MAG: dipeptide ABC transporter ATP-binding protein [Parvibaculaceae bacterium]